MTNYMKDVSIEGYVAETIPTLIVSGCSAELYDDEADELTMVTFYKEYPEMKPEDFTKKFEKLCEEGVFDDLESTFGCTLDMSGAAAGMGFDIAEYGELSEEEIESIFKEVVEIFESGKEKEKRESTRTSKSDTPLFDLLLKLSAV